MTLILAIIPATALTVEFLILILPFSWAALAIAALCATAGYLTSSLILHAR